MDNEKKVLVVYTGGTICTLLSEGAEGALRGISDGAMSALVSFYEASDSPFANAGRIDGSGKRFGILSENMTVDRWNGILRYLRGEVLPHLDRYCGIILAHGTDTLAYSAALLSWVLRGISVPVFLVSSNAPVAVPDPKTKALLPNPEANGNDNFRLAADCCFCGIPAGVYVPYREVRTEKKRPLLHLAAHLTQCRNYEDDFHSRDPLDLTGLSAEGASALFKSLPRWETKPAEALLLSRLGDTPLKDCVLKLDPYVGLDYGAFDLKKYRAVLHGSYHSGTACVEYSKEQPILSTHSVLYLMARCAGEGVALYFAPAKRSRVEGVYESVPYFGNLEAEGQRAVFCYGMTQELLYAKLLCLYSSDLPKDEGSIAAYLADHGGESVEQGEVTFR